MPDHHNGKAITQKDVARYAGVSRSIVSYVINNGPRQVSEDTRNRVLDAIKALGYRPNKYAQMLSSADETFAQKYIGIVLAGNYMFKRPYYGSILASIHKFAHERDHHIRFIRVFDDFSNPALFNELIHPNEISGVILIGLDQVLMSPNGRTLMEAIVRRVDDIVCVECEWPGVPVVTFDRQNAAYQVTAHLIASERVHIAYAGPDDKRVLGYQQALWEHHVTIDERLILHAVDSEEGYLACEQLVQAELAIDAICAGTDEAAIGILKCLHQHGFHVPHDVAVASIDNLDISAFTIPALTTVDVPKHDIGMHAVEILVSNKSGKSSSAFAITVPTTLIVRESSSTH
jgi:LacI family transcriptional regulator